MSDLAESLAAETRGLPPEKLLAHVLIRLGDRVALASSLGAEDQVVTHMLCSIVSQPRVFTLDTGRLPQETYDAIQATNERYGIRIKVLFPDRQDVEGLVNRGGPNLFYASVEARRACCRVRKVLPLRRELASLGAWITGLRREQSVTRADVERVRWDEANGLVKINPLAEWTESQVWDYIRAHNVPTNRLHAMGYPSIGCAPCTRAVSEGEDVRAGRWWWEDPEHKECGLHPGREEKETARGPA
jgi:phosphoadenosine phosphosulfate reductase